MSTEEQDAIVGRAVKEYGETRKLLAANLAKASKFGETLADISKNLTSETSPTGLRAGVVPEKLSAMPSAEEIRDLAEEVARLREKSFKLKAQLTELGFEPKN